MPRLRQRLALKEEGYLRSDSPCGVWELSEKGAGFAAGPRATFVDPNGTGEVMNAAARWDDDADETGPAS